MNLSQNYWKKAEVNSFNSFEMLEVPIKSWIASFPITCLRQSESFNMFYIFHEQNLITTQEIITIFAHV